MSTKYTNTYVDKYELKDHCKELGLTDDFINSLLDYDSKFVDLEGKKKKIEDAYSRLNFMYQDKKISIQRFSEIRAAHMDLLEYIKYLAEWHEQELESEKIKLKMLTEEMEYREKKKRELEEKMGPIWVAFEELKKTDFNSFDEMVENIKTRILEVLPEYLHAKFEYFIEIFITFWNALYEKICKEELRCFNNGFFDNSCSFSVGLDELIRDHYALGNNKELISIEIMLSKAIPNAEEHYVLESLLDIFSKKVLIDFEIRFAGLYYSFLTNSRLKKMKQSFYDMYDEERHSGIRKSPLVDLEEQKTYIARNLIPYNRYFEINEKTS